MTVRHTALILLAIVLVACTDASAPRGTIDGHWQLTHVGSASVPAQLAENFVVSYAHVDIDEPAQTFSAYTCYNATGNSCAASRYEQGIVTRDRHDVNLLHFRAVDGFTRTMRVERGQLSGHYETAVDAIWTYAR